VMADPCRELRESLGAYVLGHLDPEEDAAVAAHLEGCPSCAAELPALTETAALLAVADPLREESGDIAPFDDLSRQVTAPPDLVERVVARVGADRARRRRRKLQALTAAAAAVVVLVVAGVSLPRLLREPEEPLEQVVLVNAEEGVEATATLRPWDWGTGIELEAEGLTPRATYAVWFADSRGRRLSAGSFVALEDGRVHCRLTSAMLRPAAEVIGVTAIDEGTDILQATLH